MPYISDQLSQSLSRFIYQDEYRLQFRAHDVDVGLPITDDELFVAQLRLEGRSKIAKFLSLPSGLGLVWAMWQWTQGTVLVRDWIIAILFFAFGIVVNSWALFSVLRPFRRRLLKLLIAEHGWRRIGFRGALIENSAQLGRSVILLPAIPVLIWMRGYDSVYIIFGCIAFVVFVLFLRGLSYSPPVEIE